MILVEDRDYACRRRASANQSERKTGDGKPLWGRHQDLGDPEQLTVTVAAAESA